jgi:hypothetical protein
LMIAKVRSTAMAGSPQIVPVHDSRDRTDVHSSINSSIKRVDRGSCPAVAAA